MTPASPEGACDWFPLQALIKRLMQPHAPPTKKWCSCISQNFKKTGARVLPIRSERHHGCRENRTKRGVSFS
jgi:hypothetical protein